MKNAKKEDLRIVKTKKHLVDALFELLQTKSLEKITVVEICEKAMVNRATFYKYFVDKYALFEYFLNEIKEKIFKNSSSKTYTTNKEQFMAIVEDALTFIEENRKLLLDALQNNIEETLLLIFTDTMESALKNLLIENNLESNLKLPLNITTPFFTGGLSYLALWWLTHKNSCSKEDLKKHIETLLVSNVLNDKL